MAGRKVMKILSNKFQESANEKVYSPMTDFTIYSKMINSFIEHGIKPGQIFADTGKSQYGQKVYVRYQTLFVIISTTPCFVVAQSDMGHNKKMKVFTDENGAFFVRRDGMRFERPFNHVYRLWKKNPTRKDVEEYLSVDRYVLGEIRAKNILKIAKLK